MFCVLHELKYPEARTKKTKQKSKSYLKQFLFNNLLKNNKKNKININLKKNELKQINRFFCL